MVNLEKVRTVWGLQMVRGKDAAALAQCRRLLAEVMEACDPRSWSGTEAASFVRVFSEIERFAAAGKTLAAGRVEATKSWRPAGHRSAEEWLARETGTTVSNASGVLATANRLGTLPATEAALRKGALSPEQAAAVASAGAADGSSERRMLEDAGRESLTTLRRQAQAVRHAAAGPVVESVEERARIHRSRYFHHWTAVDGACEGRFRLTPDAGAKLLAAVAAHRRAVFGDARAGGVRDSSDAYEADALVAAAVHASDVSRSGVGGGHRAGDPRPDGGGAAGETPPAGERSAPQAVINVRVDRSALVRGHAEEGEVCEIAGIGPVPVATVRAAAHDAILRALLVDGGNVIDARAAGRTVTAAQRRAIDERDRVCVVPGCDHDRHLQIHHLVAVEDLGPTQLSNLGKVCPWHHDQITHRGATLIGPYPHWQYQPPPSGTGGVSSAPGEPPWGGAVSPPSPPLPGLA